jgi:hypothetical protein
MHTWSDNFNLNPKGYNRFTELASLCIPLNPYLFGHLFNLCLKELLIFLNDLWMCWVNDLVFLLILLHIKLLIDKVLFFSNDPCLFFRDSIRVLSLFIVCCPDVSLCSINKTSEVLGDDSKGVEFSILLNRVRVGAGCPVQAICVLFTVQGCHDHSTQFVSLSVESTFEFYGV